MSDESQTKDAPAGRLFPTCQERTVLGRQQGEVPVILDRQPATVGRQRDVSAVQGIGPARERLQRAAIEASNLEAVLGDDDPGLRGMQGEPTAGPVGKIAGLPVGGGIPDCLLYTSPSPRD